MSELVTVGIDLAKSVFQIHVMTIERMIGHSFIQPIVRWEELYLCD